LVQEFDPAYKNSRMGRAKSIMRKKRRKYEKIIDKKTGYRQASTMNDSVASPFPDFYKITK